MTNPFGALRNKIFLKLYLSQTISLLGDAFTWVGIALLAFQFGGNHSAAILSTALTEASFRVTNMVCEGCAEKITMALTALPGVKDVKPIVMQKQVQVNYYPEQIKQDELKKVLEKEGFNAVEV